MLNRALNFGIVAIYILHALFRSSLAHAQCIRYENVILVGACSDILKIATGEVKELHILSCMNYRSRSLARAAQFLSFQ